MGKWQRFIARFAAEGYAERLLHDEPMASHTSFGVGGPADLLVAAQTLEELVEWVRMARSEEVPCLVLGGGTNVLVADAGIRGLVILNRCVRHALGDSGRLTAESGASLRELAQETVALGWAGLEWAVGIPGTVGGAIVGNAGAYGGYVDEALLEAELLKPNGRVERVTGDVLEYGYRTSALKREDPRGPRTIVLSAVFQLEPGDASQLQERARQVNEQRWARTPAGACAGSMFKRTQHYPAGFLIEQAGLKGYTVGGAQVSPKHANFFMNLGNATAADIAELIGTVQERVWRDFAQRLEPEVQFIGDWAVRSAVGEIRSRGA